MLRISTIAARRGRLQLPARMLESRFNAVAFVENLSLPDWSAVFPGGRRSTHELRAALDGGEVFAYPFGAIVFRDVPPDRRLSELVRLRELYPALSPPAIQEQLTVREDSTAKAVISEGTLVLDRLTDDRAGVVAHTVAQSAALEYYERIGTSEPISLTRRTILHTAREVGARRAATVRRRCTPLPRRRSRSKRKTRE